jgi:putative sterol carrier protein
VAYFKTEQEIYEHVGGLFADLRGDEELASRFRTANTVVQFRYRHPDATITVRLMDHQDAQLDLGPTRLVPEVIMTMDADVAHRFWLGKVNVTIALARGQIKAVGPVGKVLGLVPLVRPVFARYRARLEQAGRDDLAQVA